MRTVLILSVLLLAGSTACASNFEATEADTNTTTSPTDPVRPPVIVFEGGFDPDGDACNGWSVQGGKAYTTEAITASGPKSCRVCMQTSTSVSIERVVPVDRSAAYTLVAHVRNESTRAQMSIAFTDDANADLGTFQEALANGNDFRRATVKGAPNGRPTKARIRFTAEKAEGFACIDVDDIELSFEP